MGCFGSESEKKNREWYSLNPRIRQRGCETMSVYETAQNSCATVLCFFMSPVNMDFVFIRASSRLPGLFRRVGAHAALLVIVTVLASCVSSVPSSGIGPSRNIEVSSRSEAVMDIRLERVIDHDKDNWNYLGLWRRVGKAKPAIYAPAEMAATVPLDAKHGVWIVDANDGARFFVPNNGTSQYPASTLKIEARKVTNRTTKGRNAVFNGTAGVLGVALSPLALLQGVQMP
jgi:hypothetical protein